MRFISYMGYTEYQYASKPIEKCEWNITQPRELQLSGVHIKRM